MKCYFQLSLIIPQHAHERGITKKEEINEFLLSDYEMLCRMLVKLTQFDESASSLIIDCRLLDEKVDLILKLVSSFHNKERGNNNKHLNVVPSHSDLD